MPKQIHIDDPAALAFALEKCGVDSWDHPHTISLHDGAIVIASVAYERFTGECCNAHIASDGSRHWMTRRFLRAIFAYPFIQLGLARITGIVPASNAAALAFDLHLGFQIEGRCREALPGGEDAIIIGMLRRECRFI